MKLPKNLVGADGRKYTLFDRGGRNPDGTDRLPIYRLKPDTGQEFTPELGFIVGTVKELPAMLPVGV